MKEYKTIKEAGADLIDYQKVCSDHYQKAKEFLEVCNILMDSELGNLREEIEHYKKISELVTNVYEKSNKSSHESYRTLFGKMTDDLWEVGADIEDDGYKWNDIMKNSPLREKVLAAYFNFQWFIDTMCPQCYGDSDNILKSVQELIDRDSLLALEYLGYIKFEKGGRKK